MTKKIIKEKTVSVRITKELYEKLKSKEIRISKIMRMTLEKLANG